MLEQLETAHDNETPVTLVLASGRRVKGVVSNIIYRTNEVVIDDGDDLVSVAIDKIKKIIN